MVVPALRRSRRNEVPQDAEALLYLGVLPIYPLLGFQTALFYLTSSELDSISCASSSSSSAKEVPKPSTGASTPSTPSSAASSSSSSNSSAGGAIGSAGSIATVR